jgi:hypothetical protein
MYNQPKKCYPSIEYKDSSNTKVWYTHFRGCIVKSWIDPNTNLIKEERLPYNQPDHYLHSINNYFKYHLR